MNSKSLEHELSLEEEFEEFPKRKTLLLRHTTTSVPNDNFHSAHTLFWNHQCEEDVSDEVLHLILVQLAVHILLIGCFVAAKATKVHSGVFI